MNIRKIASENEVPAFAIRKWLEECSGIMSFVGWGKYEVKEEFRNLVTCKKNGLIETCMYDLTEAGAEYVRQAAKNEETQAKFREYTSYLGND